MKIVWLITSVTLGLVLAMIMLQGVGWQAGSARGIEPKNSIVESEVKPSAANDPAESVVRYVATGGSDSGACNDPEAPCRTVQYAVDQAASGDEVRIAGGIYTDTYSRAGVVQVASITKTLSLVGGFAEYNWLNPDAAANLTVLDAQKRGRVLLITGTITVTVSNLRLTGGDTISLTGVNKRGGGVYMANSTVTISNCQILTNTTHDWGSGLYLERAVAILIGNEIRNNRGVGSGLYQLNGSSTIQNNQIIANLDVYGGYGGGLIVDHGTTVISGNHFESNHSRSNGAGVAINTGIANIISNTFMGNTAEGDGGGIFLEYAPESEIYGNIFISNTASNGGALYLYYSQAAVTKNYIRSSTATYLGGGILLLNSPILLRANILSDNYAGQWGGGIEVDHSDGAILTNNMVFRNRAGWFGNGLVVDVSDPVLMMHNTVASNLGEGHEGIFLMSSSRVIMTDTILVSHTVGIRVTGGIQASTAIMEGTLWGSGEWANSEDWSDGGSGEIGTITTSTVNIWGDPGFVDPDAGDYHIGAHSAALDAGVDAGLTDDIDGDMRPIWAGFDIGADEFSGLSDLQISQQASSDWIMAGDALTYTLRVTNTGLVDLRATITDVLPAQVSPAGTITWTAVISAPGGVWEQSLGVMVEAGYTGPLTNTVQVSTLEGAAGTSLLRVEAQEAVVGLSAESNSPTVFGQATAYTATLMAGSGVTYAWDFGDGDHAGGPTSVHTYASPGAYTATVTASNHVSGQQAQVQVWVEEAVAGLTLESSSPTRLGSSIAFTATITGGENVVYEWDFGDGVKLTDLSAVWHTYAQPGTYTVMVTASNQVSEQSQSVLIQILPYFRLYLPGVVGSVLKAVVSST